MKQIQKIINNIKRYEFISDKKQKNSDTRAYLESQRKRYIATAPDNFKSRSSSYFFSQN